MDSVYQTCVGLKIMSLEHMLQCVRKAVSLMSSASVLFFLGGWGVMVLVVRLLSLTGFAYVVCRNQIFCIREFLTC